MSAEIIPIFRATDAAKTARWYARLGFEIVSEHRFAPNLPLYLILRRGDAHLHLSEHKGDARPRALAYLWVDDVDRIAEVFGGTVAEQPWAREVALTDPDGNRLRIGQRRA